MGIYSPSHPIIVYLRNAKGFRKYPTQNWLSSISALAYCWELGRKHHIFHTKCLHEALIKKRVIRVGPNWLSFGSSRAVKDIYGYNSPCTKAGIYGILQGSGKHLVNIVDRSEHSQRRRTVATAYAPKNIHSWESAVADWVANLVAQMDSLCTTPPTPTDGGPRVEDLNFEGMQWSNLFSFEAVGKIGLSKDLHFIESGNDLYALKDSDAKVRKVSCYECFHGGTRATSMLIWDNKNFSLLKRVSKVLSTK